jgi:oxalate---CoA ligase
MRLRAETTSATMIGRCTIGSEIRRYAELQPDNVALVSSGFGLLSYRELQALIDNVRAALRRAGLSRSARVAIAVPNQPRAALATVSVSCSAVSIPLNPRQTLREIELCLSAVQPDAVLLINGVDSVVRRIAERRSVKILEMVQSRDGVLDFQIDSAQTVTRVSDEPHEPDPIAPAFILQTSGTSSEPKLIPTSHLNMLAAAARVRAWFDLKPQDRCLSVSPTFYAHGLHVTVFAPLLSGGSIAFPADASSCDCAEWFDSLKPTWYSAAPTLHRLVFDQTKSRADAKTRHSLRFILSGGAPLPIEVLEGLQQAFGVPVLEHYGSSEGLQICSNQLPPGRSKVGTCGIPWPDTIVIAAEDGTPLKPGQQGEILVGGPTVIASYLNAPELTRASFVNGWFKSGDIGLIDEEGFLNLRGRKSDLINRGGEKVSPSELDEVLLRHPAVAEAAAFSIPHPRLGEDVAAAVVLHAGMTVTSDELRRYLRDRLASFKIPRRIDIRDKLPKGKTGKVLRRLLTKAFEEEIAQQISVAAPQSEEDSSINNILVVQLKELWERLLQINPVFLDDDFSEKGGDSLLAIEMLSEVERLTGQRLPSYILFDARTIRQLARKLSDLEIQPKSLIHLNPSGSQPPLFLFHGDYLGGGLYSGRLAALLGSDQPLFVIGPLDLEGKAGVRPIEEMAADYLSVVLKAQPQGPYRLSGYCLGGLIAFEVARLLVAAGEKVKMVGMIDSPTVSARQSVQLILAAIRGLQPLAGPVAGRVAANVWHKCSLVFDRTSSISLTQLTAWLMGRARDVFVGSGDEVIATRMIAIRPNEELRLRQLFERHISDRRSNVDILTMYSPKPLAVPVLFFEAEFSSKAWRRISSDIEAVSMLEGQSDTCPDRHTEVVRNPANLEKMAASLLARLQPALQEIAAGASVEIDKMGARKFGFPRLG